jgi:hypothetical protein
MYRARGRQFGDAGLFLRTTMLERRRKVMADWAAFLAGGSGEASGSVRGQRLKKGVHSATQEGST